MSAQGNSKKNQTPPDAAYRFGRFALHPGERLLMRDGAAVPLAPKAFDALLVLVRHAGRLVRKSDLMDALWPDAHVVEANQTNAIGSLRKVLGREAIDTVSKHGYRLQPPVDGEPGIAAATHARFARAKELTIQKSLDSMTQARDLYWCCLAEVPNFAPAWAWLGRCCWFLAKFSGQPGASVDLAHAAFQRAFALDPDLASAHQFYTPVEADSGRAGHALLRLEERVRHHPGEPESYAGLVQVYRYCGRLQDSLEAHRRAVDLDPALVTSVPHTLFLAGDYAGTLESYSGRTGYYLDAAAWAALGHEGHARDLLRSRLASSSLSPLMSGLMGSLLAVLEGRPATTPTVYLDPEILVYLARHHAYSNDADAAGQLLRGASEGGFICAQDTLDRDPWLSRLKIPQQTGVQLE